MLTYNLGLEFYKLKEFRKAKNYLEKTVRIQPNYAVGTFQVLEIYKRN